MEKIRILIMHPELVVGGAEKVLLNMLDRLDTNRFEVTLLLRNKAVWDSRVPKTVAVRYMFDKNPNRGVGLVVRLYKYAMIFCPKAVYRLYGVKGNFDIAIAYHEPMLWYLPAVNAVRVSWVHTDYSVLPVCSEVKQLRNQHGLLAKEITRRRNRLICQIDKAVFVAKSAIPGYVEKTGIETEKTAVCYNLTNEAQVAEKAQEPITDSCWNDYTGIHLCAVGRIVDQKAMHRLVPMMRRLKDDGINARLFIVGDGALRQHLQEQIDTTGLHEDIIILGFSDNPYPYMAKSKLLICSSIFEAYCTATKECILLETPFVATQCSGMEEQVGGTKAGLIVPNGEDTLYEAVEQALTDEALYAQMKQDIHQRHLDLSDSVAIADIESLLAGLVRREEEK